ncbi:cytochrome c biogenesis protein CcdA [bacterium]|nr:cytochrome c biogenesis protein CcdA [bacterium]
MESVNALTALAAGALSFLSPCVLPIVPAYLGRLAALSADSSRLRHAFLFTAGFSTIFIALGISAGYVGGAAGRLLPILQIPVGVAVTIGGLHLAGLLRIPPLDRMRAPTPILRGGYLGSFLLGAAFAVAWTPCIGVVLGAILGIAAAGSNPAGAALLLALYSVGLALPFLLMAAIADRSPAALQRILGRLRGGTRVAGVVGGLLVAAIGLLIATGGLTLLSRIMPGLPGL